MKSVDAMAKIAALQSEVDALKAQLAKTWQPMPNGELRCRIDEIDTLTIDDDCLSMVNRRESYIYEVWTYLPDDVRLCRLEKSTP